MKKKLNLQQFAAQNGIITTSDINTQVREIDFVTSFARSVQQLLDILGISRPIEKANGTMLYKQTVTGTLKDGNVAEGDEIPFSKYNVNETPLGEIKVEKYAKATTIEAVAKYGYDRAVAMTDEEFKIELQNKVLGYFYSTLLDGTLTSSEKDFQMALAMAAGRVRHQFQSIGREITGVAVFANTLDVYRYIGSTQITVQTAFGMNYVKDFMGIDYLFFTSEIPTGKVVATPINNIIPYYVNPGNSEFAQMGLIYTVDSTLPMLGFHVNGNYNRAQGENYAIMGLKIVPEYSDAIAVITIDDTPTLGTLTVNSSAGTESGDTKITVSPSKEAESNVYKYKVGTTETNVVYGQNVRTWASWDGTSDITAETGQKITVVEADGSYQAQAAGSATVTAQS